jgi:hypothetical protein
VAKDGFFLERNTALFRTSCRVPSCPEGLEPHAEECVLKFGRIPQVLGRLMVSFFRAAYDLHGGEAVLILLYDPARRVFRWHCPRQTVRAYETWSRHWYASLEIEYEEPFEVPPGFVVLGDAHSHADHDAYASHLDKLEEMYKDGLHIVIGRVHRERVDFHVDFLMDGVRFPMEPDYVFAGTDFGDSKQAPAAWIDQIVVKKVHHGSSTGYGRSDSAYGGSGSGYGGGSSGYSSGGSGYGGGSGCGGNGSGYGGASGYGGSTSGYGGSDSGSGGGGHGSGASSTRDGGGGSGHER